MLHEFCYAFTDYGTIGPLTNYEINLLRLYKHLGNKEQWVSSSDSTSLERTKQFYRRRHKKSRKIFQTIKRD